MYERAGLTPTLTLPLTPTLTLTLTLTQELCCPFDHGIVIPASTVLTVGGEQRIYYEGRQGFHEARYEHAA